MSDLAAEELLAFWLAEERRPSWFKKDAAFDAELANRFGALAERAASGELAGWAETPRGALALVLLLDQLPRNLHRGSPGAFAQDGKARAVAAAAIAAGFDRQLDGDGRLFLYLPFEHGEELADQERSVELFASLGDPELLDYALRHRAIVARFGRFPHRNEALGRESTPEELAFLQEPGSSF